MIALLSALIASSAASALYERAHPNAELFLPEGKPTAVVPMLLSPDGFLWVGATRGVMRFDGAKWHPLALPGASEEEPIRVNALAQAEDGALYIGTQLKGVFRYAHGQWTRWFESETVTSLVVDRGVWVGTENGVARLDGKRMLTGVAIDKLVKHGERLWVATRANGLYGFDAEREVVHYTSKDGLPSDHVWTVYPEPGGPLWIGTELGLAQLASGKISRADDPNLQVITAITSTLDARGERTLWVSNYKHGVAKRERGKWQLVSEAKGLSYIAEMIVQRLPSGEDILWLAYGSGVARLQPQSFRTFADVPWLQGPHYFIHERRGRNELWFGAGKSGLRAFTERGWVAHPEVSGAQAIAQGDDTLFIGREAEHSGVVEFRGASAQAQPTFAEVPFDDVFALNWSVLSKTLLVSRRSGLRLVSGGKPVDVAIPNKDARVWGSAETSDGQLWVATADSGLFARKNGAWRSFDDGRLTHFLFNPVEHEGALWLSSEGGLFRLNLSNDSVERVPIGGKGSSLGVAVNPRDHSLWVLSDEFVSHLIPQGGSYRAETFNSHNGLGDMKVSLGGTIMLDSEERVWVGTDAGVAVLDSRAAFSDRFAKPLLIEDITVNEQPQQPPLVLRYDQNSLAFTAVLASHLRGGETRYRTQLVGLEDAPGAWTAEGVRSFPRLPAGAYTLRVWAKDYAENVSGPNDLAFSIPLPPWKTWWAYAAYVLSLGAAVYGVMRGRLRQLRKRAEELEEIVLKRTEEVRAQKEALELSYKEADRIFDALKQALKGSLLGGEYRLDQEIGQGGFGVVYKASEIRTGKVCAVKVFRPQSGNESTEALERFKQEGRSGVRFKHPHAIDIYKFAVTDDGVAYMVMELLTGRSLKEEIDSAKQLSHTRCQQVLEPVCEALAAAHKIGIVHRDIKPDNIFLHQENGREVVKVLDFGVAKLTRPHGSVMVKTLTMTGAVVGTPSYMAPERLENEDYDGRSDIYSVGVVMYEMIAGRPPFLSTGGNLFSVVMAHLNKAPEPITNFAKDVPEAVQQMIMRALAKVPDERPTASELAEWLRAAH